MTATSHEMTVEEIEAADQAATDPARWEAALRPVLVGGLKWLYETSQPPQAILTHHGCSLQAPEINRRVSFVPQAWKGCVVLVLEIPHLRWGVGDPKPLLNGLQENELTLFADLVNHLGRPVINQWNGAEGMDSGSLALHDPAHEALIAAVTRYHGGCGTHHSVFCGRDGCSWYIDGRRMVVEPEVATS